MVDNCVFVVSVGKADTCSLSLINVNVVLPVTRVKVKSGLIHEIVSCGLLDVISKYKSTITGYEPFLTHA